MNKKTETKGRRSILKEGDKINKRSRNWINKKIFKKDKEYKIHNDLILSFICQTFNILFS